MTWAAGARASSVCDLPMQDLWQITTTQSDLPLIRTETYRLTGANKLTIARWSSRQVVDFCSAPIDVPDAISVRFRSLASDGGESSLSRLLSRPTDKAGWPGANVERAVISPDHTRHSAEPNISSEIADLLNEINQHATAATLAPGSYVWTKPLARSRQIDLDLRGDDCGDPVGQAVAQSLCGSEILVPLTAGAEGYLSGRLADRDQFGARFRLGDAAYGVIRAMS